MLQLKSSIVKPGFVWKGKFHTRVKVHMILSFNYCYPVTDNWSFSCVTDGHVPYFIFDILPLWSMGIFFHCLQTNCSARQSSLLHLFSELFPQPFFLIQRPCSSCSTTRLRLFLTTSSFLSIPFDCCIKFIRNVPRVTIACSKWETVFASRGWGLGPSQWIVCAVTGSRMIGIVLDFGFVILEKTNSNYSNEVNLFLTKRFCFGYAIQSYYFIILNSKVL